MHSDNYFLIAAFVLYWLTFLLLVGLSKNKVRTLLVNLVPHACYSILCTYGLFYESEGGGAFVWWFYFLLFLTLHWLLVLVTVLILYFKKI